MTVEKRKRIFPFLAHLQTDYAHLYELQLPSSRCLCCTVFLLENALTKSHDKLACGRIWWKL